MLTVASELNVVLNVSETIVHGAVGASDVRGKCNGSDKV